MMFYPEKDTELGKIRRLTLSGQQRAAALLCVVLLACAYYFVTNLNATIQNEVDNYLNYRFCWEVKQ